jgi:hypothetical protein
MIIALYHPANIDESANNIDICKGKVNIANQNRE